MTDAPLVRLRDLTLADADLVDAWQNDPNRSEFNDFGEPQSPLPRDALAAGPLRNEHNGMLIVETLDGRPIGTVGWHKVRYGPSPQSDAWNFGIELRHEERGRGYGTEAQRELARWLFENTDVTASRHRPTLRTSPSSERWRRPATCERGSSEDPSSGQGAITTL